MDDKFTTTTDHNEIKAWVEKHHGRPQIDDFSSGASGQKMLRVDFPGEADDQLLGESDKPHNTSWEAFFKEFEDQGLAFMYAKRVNKDDPSMSYRFVPRNSS